MVWDTLMTVLLHKQATMPFHSIIAVDQGPARRGCHGCHGTPLFENMLIGTHTFMGELNEL